MPTVIVPGQDDVTLNVGDPGDKTVTLVIASTHVKIDNDSPLQGILASVVAAPTYPGDWFKVESKKSMVVQTDGSINLHLRKKSYYRHDVGMTPANKQDVPATVQVGLLNMAI